MARLKLKIFLIAVAAFLVAAHFVLWVVISRSGPGLIQDYISRSIGWEVQTDGVKFSLLSEGVKIKNLRICDPTRPDAAPLFSAKRIKLRLNLFALLAGRLTIKKIIVLSPSLNLSRNGGGHWIMPAEPPSGPTAQDSSVEKTAPPTKSGPAKKRFRLAVCFEQVDLRKGEIFLRDATVSPPFWVRIKNIHAKGSLKSTQRMEFRLDGKVECKDTATLRVEGEMVFAPGAPWNATVKVDLQNLDMLLLAPYYQPHSPAAITGGKFSMQSTLHCDRDMLKDSLQTITLQNIMIHSWREEFLQGSSFGIPNKELADYVNRNCGELRLDFSVAGPVKEVASLTGPDAWKALGASAVNQWFSKERSQ